MPSIKFKFRSSLKFESVDIGGRASISVAELKSRIRHYMNLTISSDSDLVLSDAVSGQEYKEENAQIESGSSVIVKRVPAGSPSFNIKSINPDKNAAVYETKQNEVPPPDRKDNDLCKLLYRGKVEVIDFDDFGEDLCAVPKGILLDPGFKIEKEVCDVDEQPDLELDTPRDVVRHKGRTIEECHKLDQSDLSEDVTGGNPMQAGLGLTVEDNFKVQKTVDVDPYAIQIVDLPLELKCPLCDSVYKEAMMIPCCQHSFCGNCIRLTLIQKGKCPKCLSPKCRAENLLPNPSLRKAIEHFLELRRFTGGTEDACRQYAPDGESGIQVKDVCGEVTILQREDEFVQSSSATGRGPNHIVGELTRDSMLGKKNLLIGGNGSHINLQDKANQVHVDYCSGHNDECIGMAVSDFQGENQPVMEQADSSAKKSKGIQISSTGDDVKIMETRRSRKGDRACYMCGSLDHLIRDCPVASGPDFMFQRGNRVFPGTMPGYMPQFWNGTPLPYVRPFPEQYPYMLPFGAENIPSPAFHGPYMPPYGGLHHHGGFMMSGGTALQYGVSGGHNPNCQALKSFEDQEKNLKIGSEEFRRETSFDDRGYEGFGRKPHFAETIGRAYGDRSHTGKETSASYSDESSDPKYLRKHQHQSHSYSYEHLLDERHEKTSKGSISDRKGGSHHHRQRLFPEVDEDMPARSSSNQQSEESNYHHQRGPKKDKERREKRDSDSSLRQKASKRKREESNAKRKTENCHHLKHDLNRGSPVHDERKMRNQKHSHNSRHREPSRDSGDEEKSINKELISDRWKMASGSIEYTGRAHHRSRHRRSRAD